MSETVLKAFCAMIAGIFLAHLFVISKKEKIHQQDGWSYILAGFSLILFGMIIDISDNFPNLYNIVIMDSKAIGTFLENILGYLLGYILLAMGFSKWMPTVIAFRDAQELLKKSSLELESRVDERTSDLETLNDQLRQEIGERKRMEEALRKSEEASKRLA